MDSIKDWKMFDFEEIHLKALIKLLNFINQEFHSSKTITKLSSKTSTKTKSTPKSTANQLTIASIEANNKLLIIDCVINCCNYFDQYFRYNYKFVNAKTEDKISKVHKWLSNYYRKPFLDTIDFKQIIQELPENAEESDKTQTEEINNKIAYNLKLILLLVVIIYYKVRHLFPKMLDYLEFAWIYLLEFESELESMVNMENLIELLQNEFVSQRNANRIKSEVLSNELIQLNQMIENLEKQYEEETKELIYLQNANIIGNNSINNSLQIGKLMSQRVGEKIPKTYMCPECGKSFKNSYKLNRHRYVHKDPSEKPFLCDWPGCGYRSIANNDLNRHKMIHTGEKPFRCDYPGCERKYARPDKLNHHKKITHNKETLNKPFACDWPGCGYRTIANADLTRHHMIHTGEKPYKCNFEGCDKAFSRPDKLRNHKDKARHEDYAVRDERMSITEIPDITIHELPDHRILMPNYL